MVATVDVWGVSRSRIPSALWAMARERRPLRQVPGVRFGKLLGTGTDASFAWQEPDLRHWMVVAEWESREHVAAFHRSAVVRRWNARSEERLSLLLSPVSSRGRWSGRPRFRETAETPDVAGPVAALTRARLAPRQAAAFWRAVPPVAAAVRGAPGLLLALPFGEAPLGWQGTLSLWRSPADLVAFAHGSPEHAAVVRRTPRQRWYAEELFARFAVLSCTGRYRGRPVDLGAPGA